MEDKACPLCGKPVNDSNDFCEDCRQMAKDEFPNYLLSEKESDEISTQDVSLYADEIGENKDLEPDTTDPNYALLMQKKLSSEKARKSRKKSLIIFFIGLILLVVIGAAGSYIFKQEKEAKTFEVAFWNECAKENTPLSYSKYLVRFPNGQFNAQAEERILNLRKEEQDAWNSLQEITSINAYMAFNEKYPKSPYTSLVVYKIDSLAWLQAKKANTTDAYKLYLQKVDSGIYIGKFAPNATKEYEYINQLKEVQGKALNDIKREMKDLAKFLSSGKYESASRLMEPILINYIGIKNKETKTIFDDIKKYNKENKIKSIIYTFETDSIKVFQDNNNIFLFDMPISKQTTFTDKNKKSEKNEYILRIELNSKKQVQSVTLK